MKKLEDEFLSLFLQRPAKFIDPYNNNIQGNIMALAA